MIVTCPACTTRYLVDPRSIGEAGRRVRCARCKHLWLQPPPAGGIPPGLAEPAAAEPKAPPPTRIQLPAVPPPPRSRFRQIAWGGVAAGALLLLASATFWRDDIAGLFAPPEPPGAGLALRNVASKPGRDGRVLVEGEIVNVSDSPRPVPKLEAVMREGQRDLGRELIEPAEKTLAPGGKVPFSAEVKRADSATDVVVTFARGS